MFVSFDSSFGTVPFTPLSFLALTIAHFLRLVKTNPPTPISSYFASLRGSKLPTRFAYMRTPIPPRGGEQEKQHGALFFASDKLENLCIPACPFAFVNTGKAGSQFSKNGAYFHFSLGDENCLT
jgi:hypothetical protein